jgi:hypothetical protein
MYILTYIQHGYGFDLMAEIKVSQCTSKRTYTMAAGLISWLISRYRNVHLNLRVLISWLISRYLATVIVIVVVIVKILIIINSNSNSNINRNRYLKVYLKVSQGI